MTRLRKRRSRWPKCEDEESGTERGLANLAQLQLEIITAEGQAYSGVTELVVAPGQVGEFTVLPSHAPLITTLQPGEVRLTENGESTSLVVSGGFLEVNGNRVVILADAAERDDDIDLERAEAAVQQARERIENRSGEMDLERALSSLRRAQARVGVARRRRQRRSSSGAPQ